MTKVKKTHPKRQGGLETPEKDKEKKPLPEGCGGRTQRTLECVLCQRPRDKAQRGAGCPTCLNLMRKKGERSIQKVLSDSALHEQIRGESLKEKPLEDPDKDLKDTVAKLERAVELLKRRRR